MIVLLLAVLLNVKSYQPYTIDYVDIIEVNYVYKNWAEPETPTFKQSIYKNWKRTWTWSEEKNKKVYAHGFEIVDWRDLDHTGLPVKNWRTGNWEQKFYDERGKCHRKIIALGTVTTHTVDDPEVEARTFLQSHFRIKLSKPREQK